MISSEQFKTDDRVISKTEGDNGTVVEVMSPTVMRVLWDGTSESEIVGVDSVSTIGQEKQKSRFRTIAERSIARGENRILPIVVGAKKPAITWADKKINTASAEEWASLAAQAVDEIDAAFPDLNACVLAKPDEFLFVDHDTMKEFREGYEKFSGKPYPITFTTSARDNRCQEHWKQTDLTRKLGNVAQFAVDDIDLSVRQRNLYVLAEGSRHPSGSIYEVVVDAPIVSMPDEMVDYIQSLKQKAKGPSGTPLSSGPAIGQRIPYGQHDVVLTAIAGKWRQDGQEFEQIRDGLTIYCEKYCDGYKEDYREMTEKIAKSVCRYDVGDPTPTVLIGNKLPGEGAVQASKKETGQTNSLSSYQLSGFETTLSPEELEAEISKDYPVIPLVTEVGPNWSDDILYGLSGEIVKKASEYNEAHPAGMLLDLLVSLGSIFGRNPHFIINKTKHFTNEFMARVGASAYSRKGSGRDEIDALLKIVDNNWFTKRTVSGFGSAEAIIGKIQDATEQQRFNSKNNTFTTVHVPGVDDKRLCIREGELASVFVLAGKQESRADIVLRDGWDGKPLKNVVKGKTKDGLSNSLTCEEPHISISGDTTLDELLRKLPDGSEENGFGNRFLYCYVYRVKLCPQGGPEINWSDPRPGGKSYLNRLYEVIEFAKKQGLIPLVPAAKNTCTRLYLDIENNHLPGLAGKMTSRAAPHVRRLAMIYALLDMESAVDTKHLRAAKRLWDYCEDSAQFCFNKMTKKQLKLFRWIEKQQESVTPSMIQIEFYKKNEKIGFVESVLNSLVALGHLEQVGETYRPKQS